MSSKKSAPLPHAPGEQYYYFHLLVAHFCLFCLTIHSAFAVIYLGLDMPVLSIVNALAIGIFYIALKLNMNGRPGLAWCVINIETLLYAALSAFEVGNTGARDLIVFLPMLFFLFPVSFSARISYLLFIALYYVALACIEIFVPAVHSLETSMYQILNIGMDAALIFGLAYFIFYAYRAIVNKEEGFKTHSRELREKFVELEKLSVTDKLTGLYNRNKIEQVLAYELERSSRYNTKFSVVLIDIDHFKSINDTYGHNVGDRVLITFSDIMSRVASRKTDIVGRWGGEEFIVICSETDDEGASVLAEKIRENIYSHDFLQVGRVTASFGVGEYVRGLDSQHFIELVDKALYQSKSNGRNRTTVCKEYVAPGGLKIIKS